MKKQFLSFCLITALLLALIPQSAVYAAGTTRVQFAPSDNSAGNRTVAVALSGDAVDRPISAAPSDKYSPELALLSLLFAMTATPSKDGKATANTEAYLAALGFDSRSASYASYSETPTADTIGSYIARKTITDPDGKPCTLVAVAVRGGDYGDEWLSNFKLADTVVDGTQQFHKGFATAADKVYNRVMDYTKTIDGAVKVWIVGYSRGAAVANLTAGDLMTHGKMDADDVYAYTFATPQVVRSNSLEQYDNIFNLIAKNDIVPKLPPAGWGFTTYGLTRILQADVPEEMLTTYDALLTSNGSNPKAKLLQYSAAISEKNTALCKKLAGQLTKKITSYNNFIELDAQHGIDLLLQYAQAEGVSQRDAIGMIFKYLEIPGVSKTALTNLFKSHSPEIYLSYMLTETGFDDVAYTAWYAGYVKTAAAAGLIDGISLGKFSPQTSLTLAQTVKLATCFHQKYTQGAVTLANGPANWYDTYVAYAVAHGLLKENEFSDWNAPAKRAEVAYLFANALPEGSYKETKQISALPDVTPTDRYGSEIFKLYRAGILTGNDAARTFAPQSQITRAEAAAILARMPAALPLP